MYVVEVLMGFPNSEVDYSEVYDVVSVFKGDVECVVVEAIRCVVSQV